jgi:hypothetical protein
MRFWFVRRQVIHNMLRWFIENNPSYADVDLDLESLALYPEEVIVPDILNSSVIFVIKLMKIKWLIPVTTARMRMRVYHVVLRFLYV